MSKLETIVEDLKTLPPDRLDSAADYIRRLKMISSAERNAILDRTAGSLTPEEGDRPRGTSKRVAKKSMNAIGSVLLDTTIVVDHLRGKSPSLVERFKETTTLLLARNSSG